MKIIAYIRLMQGNPSAMTFILLILFSSSVPAKQKNLGIVHTDFINYLVNNDPVGVKNTLQYCDKCLQNIDPLFLDWANAILEYHKKNYAESIQYYRKIISARPDWYSARLQLATVLYLNKDILSAEEQLRKLRSEHLTEEAAGLIDRFIARVQKTDHWSFRGGFTYLNEKNINNVPPSGRSIRGWKPEKPQSGKGVMFWGEAEKRFSLPDNFFVITRLATSGKTYWNNHSYDELDGSVGVGAGYRNVNTMVQFIPFYEKSYYSGGQTSDGGLQSYSDTTGIKVETEFQLASRWRLYSDAKLDKNEYKKKTYLNGYRYSLNETLIYFPDSRQYISAGLGYSMLRTEEKDSSFNKSAFRAGWMYEWDGGISTLLQAAYGYKKYLDGDFWGIKQMNHEYSTSVTVWHRDIYFFGVTPKITWNYQRTDSNHPFYDTERNRLFLSFSKYF
ncbi:DUF560 domain-containing protein [Salmonella enterica]|uniref:DUF560 domain-containing protein n=8 Tax=Salmonella enterica TaxID=28901 RepID=A0A6Y1QQT5_SALDZ|nr:surface lipoprotein assembly modifier [Salmonella enterica]EAA1782795.1 hypothetical protein [Salmonella enterica subsp. diarizonae]EBH8035545.1 DUF560 domain-containing protein [Salmonella bongori]EBR3855739.1 DUF560 domain-containing protein [Salmonella enterica subsp. enterica]ECT9716585.1 DUF560 domain-containing protein [Salmonella enterica subsp. diarizonae str. CFSAN000553]EDN4537242.1 DUF560 domain-containing protein [Salmonella enterica subsp. diarizonae serovar 47:k:z35]EDQ384236